MTQATATAMFSSDVVLSTGRWLNLLALNWHQEIPQRIHTDSHEDGLGPDFHPDFLAYIERPCRKPDCHSLNCAHGRDRKANARVRTKDAFRRLKRMAPREFDVLYLLCVHNLSFREASQRMTERAIRLEKPERYTEAGVLVLAVAAVDKVSKWL